MMKIAIAGCTGRMGLTLVKAVSVAPGVELVMGSEKPGYDENQVQALLAQTGVAGLKITTEPGELAQAADAVIDFTSVEATLALTKEIAAQSKIHVVGTTGFSTAQAAELGEAGQGARIVWSGNMSFGVNILAALVEKAAGLLSDDYDIEVDEMHHAHKKDNPSGTALLLGRAAAKGRGVEFHSVRNYYNEGIIGERKRGTIGLSARRGGEVVGVHTVTFAGPGENLELTHRGFSRNIYANGAVKAARWAQNKPAGLYSMVDVLGL